MNIEFIDILILLIPLLMLNIYLSSPSSLSVLLSRYRFPFILLSYTVLIITPVLILLIFYEILMFHTIVFSDLQYFKSDLITEISSFNINFITNFILAWLISVLYISLIFSQIGLRLLNNIIGKYWDRNSNVDDLLSETTLKLLKEKHIRIGVLSSMDFGLIFSSSYLNWKLRRNNFIYINQSILKSLSADEVNAAIIHEIGHIHNMDTIFYPIINSLSKILFFLPNLKTIRNSYQDLIEQKADNFAVKYIHNPQDLANVIMKTVTFMKKVTKITAKKENTENWDNSEQKAELNLLLRRVRKLGSLNTSILTSNNS